MECREIRGASFRTSRAALSLARLQNKDENGVWPILAGSGEASGGAAPSCRSAQVTSAWLDPPLPFPVQTGSCLAAAGEAKDEAQLSLLCEEP